MRFSKMEKILDPNKYGHGIKFVTVHKISTVTNSTPGPYFWGTKNFDYIFENLIKNRYYESAFFLDISTLTMCKIGTLMIKG